MTVFIFVNCQCFLCNVKLDGWEDGDDPIAEHLTHSPDCAWAISKSLERKFANDEAVDTDPMSEEMVAIRTRTFGDNWPNEQKKGWKPKVAKVGSEYSQILELLLTNCLACRSWLDI